MSYLRSPACKLQLRLIALETGTCRPARSTTRGGALRVPTDSVAYSPPPRGLAALFEVHSGTAQQCVPGNDCCENSSAAGKGCVEKLRRFASGAVFGLRPLLLALAGLCYMDGSAWPCAMSTLTHGLPCLTLELPPHHGRVWWLLMVGWPWLSSLHSLYEFCCSRFQIYYVSKRTFSLQGISKSLEINCVWQLYKWN